MEFNRIPLLGPSCGVCTHTNHAGGLHQTAHTLPSPTLHLKRQTPFPCGDDSSVWFGTALVSLVCALVRFRAGDARVCGVVCCGRFDADAEAPVSIGVAGSLALRRRQLVSGDDSIRGWRRLGRGERGSSAGNS